MYGFERSQKDLTITLTNAITSIFNITQSLLVRDELSHTKKKKEEKKVNNYEQSAMTTFVDFAKRATQDEKSDHITLDMSNGVSKSSDELEPNIELDMGSNVTESGSNIIPFNTRYVVEDGEDLVTLEDVISEIHGNRAERSILPHLENISENTAKYMYLPDGIIPQEKLKEFDDTFQNKLIPFITNLELNLDKRFIFRMESYISNGAFRIRSFDFTTRECYPDGHKDCIVIQFSKGYPKMVNG